MSSRNKGPYAQHFHLTPEQGLLNDPNGLCYFQGYYHIFYQYNPYATDHSTKYWGHVRSKDFVTYEQLVAPSSTRRPSTSSIPVIPRMRQVAGPATNVLRLRQTAFISPS